MKKKLFPLSPSAWFTIICVAIIAFFVLLKPAEQMDVKRDVRQTIKKATGEGQVKESALQPKAGAGVVDNGCVSGVEFYGDPSVETKFEEGMIIMEGRNGSRWAYALIQFAKPVNFFASTITFFAKGGREAQAMEVGFTDTGRRTTSKDESLSLALSDEYQKVSIRVADIRSVGLNKGEIAALKIGMEAPKADMSTQAPSEGGALRLYIKDMACVSNQEYLDIEEKTAQEDSLLEPSE